jgi:hypothetical protein
MADEAEKREHTGLGAETVERDGDVSVQKGEVMIRRVTGEAIKVSGKVNVYTGDKLFWIADCAYTLQYNT